MHGAPMNDDQIIKAGSDAAQVLDNPAYQAAMAQLHDLALKAFKATDIRDAEGLKLARQFAAVTDDFEQILKRMVEGGKFASLNLNKHRNENAAQRMLRTVIR